MGIFDILGEAVGLIPGIGGVAKAGINAITGGGSDEEKSGGGFFNSPGGAAAIQGAGGLIGSLFAGAQNKADREYAEKMQEKMWGKQDERYERARGNLKPEQDYVPTYGALKQSAPLLMKLIGGNIGKFFGGDADEFGVRDILNTIQNPGYSAGTGEVAGSGTTEAQATIPQQRQARVPRYFREKYGNQMRGR